MNTSIGAEQQNLTEPQANVNNVVVLDPHKSQEYGTLKSTEGSVIILSGQ
jgi:hypothetical protein